MRRHYKILLILLFLASTLLGSPAKAEHAPLKRAVAAIAKYYVAPERLEPKKLYQSAIEQIERSVPEALAEISKSKTEVTVGLAKRSFDGPPRKMSDLAKRLSPIINFVEAHREHFPDEPSVAEAAIEGITEALDPHTNFLSPKIFKEFRIGTRGKFGGLGIVIGIRDGNLTVIAPLEGTPAWRAGIKSGDKIVQIKDESTVNMSLTDAVSRLRGKIGTKVRIVVERTGKPKPMLIALKRALIKIDSLQFAPYKYDNKTFGYIRLKNFQSNTVKDFNAAIKSMSKKAPLSGIILDLRNNTGGLLNEAVKIADRFLKKGMIVSTITAGDKVSDEEFATNDSNDLTIPTIVLVNEGSASASEIVAGALKINKRAIVVGDRTFGKGTVQTIIELGDDSALKLTIAQYLAAGTYPIQQEGVIPDIKLIPAKIEGDEIDILEDEARGEYKLDNPLGIAAGKKEKPVLTVSFLKPNKEEEDSAYYSSKPKLDDDFATIFAAKIISGANGSSPEDLIDSAKVQNIEVMKDQDTKIAAALQKQGINWKQINQATPEIVPVKLNHNMYNKHGAKLDSATAGEEFFLELEVTNNWKKAIPRLIANIKDPDEIGGIERELAFGLLGPGKTAKQRLKITLPTVLSNQRLDLVLTLKSGQSAISKSITLPLNVMASPKPRFEFSYKMPNKLSGKKQILMKTSISNVGKTATGEHASATIHNDCGDDLFIESGRSELKKLKPGAKKNTLFKFHMNKAVFPPSCIIKLSLTDTENLILLTQRIALTEAGPIPPSNKKYAPPIIVLPKPPIVTNKSHYTLEGSVNDIDEVKDWMVYLGEDKIAYHQNPNLSKTMPIELKISLKKGRNVINIIARNKYDLSQRFRFTITRD